MLHHSCIRIDDEVVLEKSTKKKLKSLKNEASSQKIGTDLVVTPTETAGGGSMDNRKSIIIPEEKKYLNKRKLGRHLVEF